MYILGAGFSKHAGFPLAKELGGTIIEDPKILEQGRIRFSPNFNRVIDYYDKVKKKVPFEELWITIQKDADSNKSTTLQWWLMRYFEFAIRLYFLRRANEIEELPQAYSNFFGGIKFSSSDENTDALVYMNWDPLPELYCGVCYSIKGKMEGRPFFHPIGASSRHLNVKSAPGICILRPAGGINLLEVPEARRIDDRTQECFPICQDPQIYLETNLDPKKRYNLTLQAGELEYLITPGSGTNRHPFARGQLREAEKEFKKAKRIIVIGYRFPSYDDYIRRWVQSQDFSGKEIIIVDPDPQHATYKYFLKISQGAKLALSESKFEESPYSKMGWNKA